MGRNLIKNVKAKKASMKTSKKFRITITHTLFAKTADAAKMMKARVKAKVPRAVFSKVVKTSRGYKFQTKTTYLQTFGSEVTTSAVKQYLQARSPYAKITVTKV